MSDNPVTLEELLDDQAKVIRSIERTVVNFTKLGKANMTRGATQSRIELLKRNWDSCQQLDRHISHEAGDQDRALPYFTEEHFDKAEASYLGALGNLYDWLDSLNPSASTSHDSSGHNASHNVSQQAPTVRLPQIVLPKFTGDYLEWENYRDLFESLIHQNPTLSKVQRFHYLKTSLDGAASQLLKSVQVTDANYDAAWVTMKERYDNKRVLISSHLQSLMGVASVSTETAGEIRRLRDQTNEPLTALKNLGRAVAEWSDLLVYLTVQKLDVKSRRAWELSLDASTAFPTYKDLDAFLENRARALEAIQASTATLYQTLSKDTTPKSSFSSSKSSRTQNVKSHHVSNSHSSCTLCSRNHVLAWCPTFRRKSLTQRQEFVQSHPCCYNCLREGHMAPQCTHDGRCKHCQRKHHTLLHPPPQQSVASTQGSALVQDQKSSTSTPKPVASTTDNVNLSSSTSLHLSPIRPVESRAVLLATAQVNLRAENGRTVRVRALLDQGSQSSFVTESIAQLLRASRRRAHVTVSGLGGQLSGTVRSIASLQVSPCDTRTPSLPFEAYVLQRLTSYVPKRLACSEPWPLREEILLADPEFQGDRKIDLLLGADVYAAILLDGIHRHPTGGLTAQNTIFGWILSGPIVSPSPQETDHCISVHHCADLENLNDTLTKFWELEELPRKPILSPEDESCEQQFVSSHCRGTDGRYTVRLPFKNDSPLEIGTSLRPATSMLYRLERRLQSNPVHAQLYRQFMEEYEQLGHMERAPPHALKTDHPAVYLPHHGVFRESSSTTRLRAVFNASSRTSNGTSLNDHLLTGPKLQPDLVVIILRWRRNLVAFVAGVEKMFRQIRIHPDDADYQRIVWRSSPEHEVTSFRLLTVTYGTRPAPYLALRVLQQLAEDEQERYPSASKVLREDFYVDDVTTGTTDVLTAQRLRRELALLLESGGFHLRKWASSHPEVLADVPADQRASTGTHQIKEDESIRVLGLVWDPVGDCFQYNVVLPSIDNEVTKRSILSITARLFDPLGILAPVVITAKILMQELWLQNVGWDDPVPHDLQEQWLDYCRNLPGLQAISVPRYVGLHPGQLACEIHGFADASTRAYAAVVYLRVVHDFDNVQVTLLLAKTKVAPVKQISVPRLELCAAQLLAKLIEFVRTNMDLQAVSVHAWTDSAVVIAWIQSHSSRWRTFIANRVSDIQTRLPNVTWRHVSTHDNPADCASRGITPEELQDHSLWWHGPAWLRSHSTMWPRTLGDINPDVDLEIRENAHVHHIQRPNAVWNLPDDFSSWPKLLRVTAYCMRFGKQARLPRDQRTSAALSAVEIGHARTFWIRQAQLQAFSAELTALKTKRPLPSHSPLIRLNVFLDRSGLIRLGGRLLLSPLPFNERHPIVLPRHRISDLLVLHAHERSLHGGPQLTLRILRQQYWLLGGRQLTRSFIHRCVPCIRARAQVRTQIMGNLPAVRSTPSRPFAHTGVDYAGPVLVRTSTGRGRRCHKAYIALFVCLSVKAIHLELVNDYTSASFLAAFRRFVSRRGIPSDVYSDHGTTFQGAEAELRRAFRAVTKDRDLAAQLASSGTNWHFIPPAAPHFGGIWEAGVKSMKSHLKRVMNIRIMTAEELNTLLTQIEACLNSRPLSPLNDDPDDAVALTPGHFLVGTPLVAVPEPSVLDVNENRLSRWQLVQHMTEHFWKRWSSEYLHTLQQRFKWNKDEPNLQVNELVLVRNELLPPSRWPLGRIVECHPGPDGKTRVVTVRTATSTLKRPIVKICPLSIRSADSESTP